MTGLTWIKSHDFPKDKPFLVAQFNDEWWFEIAWFEPSFGLFITDTRGPYDFYALVADECTHWSVIPAPATNNKTTA